MKYVESVQTAARAAMHPELTRTKASSVKKRQQSYNKPCHYKRNSHLRTSFYGKDKLFQLSEMFGFKNIKGVTNRDDPLNTFYDPTADMGVSSEC